MSKTHYQNRTGWVCPNCKRGVAPHVRYCDCTPKQAMPYVPYIPYVPYVPYAPPFQRWWIGDPPGWLDPVTFTYKSTNGSTALPEFTVGATE